jgi:hypothetical protein
MLECIMAKNVHAVALGKLGGAKGGRARAKALGPRRRREIAKLGAVARSGSLSASKRQRIARRAAQARWARLRIVTATDAPECVTQLLKTYDPAELDWMVDDHRYAVVREIILRGSTEARRWLARVLRRTEVRALLSQYRGAGCTEPERRRLRARFRLTREDIPERWHLPALWEDERE